MGKLVAVLMVVVVVVTGCSGADDVARAAQKWIGQTDDILVRNKGVGRPSVIREGDPALKTQVSDHLDAAPAVSSRMSPELQASLRASIDQARKLQEFHVYLDDIAARAAGTDSAVTSMVSRATGRFNLRAEARQLLKDAGEEILQDVTCDFAWRLMAPDEQSAVNSSGSTGSTMSSGIWSSRRPR